MNVLREARLSLQGNTLYLASPGSYLGCLQVPTVANMVT